MARADNPVVEAAGRFLNSFKRPATLLIAISGGSDSTGLLVALATLCATGRYPGMTLSACTIDHGLRAASAEEAQWVEALCARYGIRHSTRRWEGPKPEAGLQAAARAKRYVLLAGAALDAGADAILSAHTGDDQRETVAMRAARSTEGVGLSGMADAVLLNGAVWLMRPFLDVGRAEIRAFLAQQGESWIDDPSNINPRFERVRVRTAADAVMSGQPHGQRALLAARAADFLNRSVGVERFLCSLAPPAMDAALSDPAAWRGLLLLAAAVGGRVHVLDARAADRLRAFLASGTLSRLTAGRVVFDRRREGLALYRECRGISPLVLQAGETGTWDGRYRVVNRTGRSVVVSAAGERAGQGLHGAVLRASRAAPRLDFEDGEAVPDDVLRLEHVIAPYAHFLSRFDLPLAQVLAALLGRTPFVSPPNE